MSRQVVLVHGIWYGPISMALLALRLDGMGFQCHRFGYPTLSRSVRANAQHLYRYARELNAEQLDFVGHSLGGLVILNLFERFDDLPPGRVVLLGSPVLGSKAASRMVEIKAARPLIGEARTGLERTYTQAPPGRETGIIAGTSGIGLGRVIENLEKPHDGTIAVSETRLDDATDSLQLPVSHTGLVLAGPVAEAIASFLRHGRFDHEMTE